MFLTQWDEKWHCFIVEVRDLHALFLNSRVYTSISAFICSILLGKALCFLQCGMKHSQLLICCQCFHVRCVKGAVIINTRGCKPPALIGAHIEVQPDSLRPKFRHPSFWLILLLPMSDYSWTFHNYIQKRC